LFSAATLAEVVRGGLQGIPKGQEEAASALGLSYWKAMRVIILPQALRIVTPALVSVFINFVKGTSLVAVIGLFDLVGTAMLAPSNPKWIGRTAEPLVFVAGIFWVMCYSMSLFSRHLEKKHRIGQVEI
jgi:general L-amino acid transport system permease protein